MVHATLWIPGYGVCGVCTRWRADYSFVVAECDNMAGGYDVVYTDKGGAVSIWYYGEWVGSDMGYFFDGFRFH